MKAVNLATRVILLVTTVAVGLIVSGSGHALSQPGGDGAPEDASSSLAYDSTFGPALLGDGHISGSFVARFPCCSLPGRWAYDNIAFPSDRMAALLIHIAGGQVHDRWTWRYYNPDGSLHSDNCYLELRNPGEAGNNTLYVALITSCPGDGQPWGVMEMFPAGCPCDATLWHGPGPQLAGHDAMWKIGTWQVYVDYTDPQGTTTPAVVQDVMYLMHTPAVLIVHGWEADCGTVAVLQDNLRKELAIPASNLRCYDYNSRKGVEEGAQQLKRNMKDFRQRLALFPEEEVDIVGHSMGGLVARYYQQFEWTADDGPTGSISMLGTPNNGVAIGEIERKLCNSHSLLFIVCDAVSWASSEVLRADLTSDAVDDMAPGSYILQKLNEDFALPQWPDLPIYSAHAGTHHTPWGGVTSWSTVNDCLVSMDSVGGPNNVFDPNPYDVTHSKYVPLPGCDEPSLTDDLSVVGKVAATIKGYPAGGGPDLAGGGVGTQGAAAGLSSAEPMITSAVDYVTPSGSKTHTIAVPSGLGNTAFVVYWLDSDTQEANLGVTLRRPNGQVVNPTDPDVVDEAELTSEGAFYVLFRGTVMSAPEAGDWQITVDGLSTPQEGQAYLVALVPPGSQVALGAETTLPRLPQGQPEVITAAIFDGSTALSAGSISAQVSTPAGNQVPVTLRDDGTGGDEVAGDHIYSGTFASTEECGGYGVTVNAGADSSEGTVTRQQFTSFDSQVAGDAVRDPCNPDEDSDGLSDAQELSIGTDPFEPDTDSDGMPDGYEHYHSCLNPLVNDAAADPDGDGQSSLSEYAAGTNPCSAGAAVGGIAEAPDVESDASLEAHGSSAFEMETMAGMAAASALMLVASGWYVRKRRRRLGLPGDFVDLVAAGEALYAVLPSTRELEPRVWPRKLLYELRH